MIEMRMQAWQPARFPLSAEQAVEVAHSGLVRVDLQPGEIEWLLRPESIVGVAQSATWDLRVRPAIGIPKLFFLLSYALDPSGWRQADATFDEADDVTEAVASAFATHAGRALDRGVLRGYVHVED